MSHAFSATAGAVILSALDVSCGVETMEANEEDRRSCFGIREFLEEVAGLHGLGNAPWIGLVLRESERKKEERAEREDGESENASSAPSGHSGTLPAGTGLILARKEGSLGSEGTEPQPPVFDSREIVRIGGRKVARPRVASWFGSGEAREAERFVVAVAVDHEVGIASSSAECFEVFVFLGADVVVEACHARESERADFEAISANCGRTGEAIAGAVARDSTRLEERKSGLDFGKRRSAVEIGEEPFGTEERKGRGGCGRRRN